MKMKIFSFLPKSATVTFQQNPSPFSPGRENNHKLKSSHVNKGFSGQLIPDEARRKSSSNDRSFDSTQEPTSPKVSCMGQIKLKKKVYNSKSPNKEEQDHQKKNKKRTKNHKDNKPSKTSEEVVPPAAASSKISKEENKKKFDSMVSNNKKQPSLANTKAAPSLDQMKRFASGRESLANFDWRDFHDDDGQEDEEDEVCIAHSAPLLMGGGGRVAMEPKKEINLWKRRTTTPPKPLQISVTNKDN
ncbi:hypothetical protein MKW98_010857 [Papaver atlanticum]|uniref:Syringolide-induced protein 14-1-1 n=1 Tax=Papaver atlanticum TaxID=357466 RepID=A0AAD4SM77_9MAGN|nr:hypothetical protein MKW98_010857 [Papaver atlanticum]